MCVPVVSLNQTLAIVPGVSTGLSTENQDVPMDRMEDSAGGRAESAKEYHSNQ